MKNLRVVLAEDGPTMAMRLGTILSADFDLVATVGDGAALLRHVRELRPDVIVTDMSMPHMTGLEVVQTLLNEDVDIGIVFVTVHSEAQVVRLAMGLGACSYVLKTDAGDDLLPAVRAAHARRFFLSRSLIDRGLVTPGCESSIE